MSSVLDEPQTTVAELLAMPEDGYEYYLIQGHLYRRKSVLHVPAHASAMVQIGTHLETWNQLRPLPRGTVYCGNAGVCLARQPDTVVGVDVVYVAAKLDDFETEDTTLIDLLPTLVIEILSPSEVFKDIKEKIELYQKHRVPLIWVIDPYDRTVTIYRLDAEPELVNVRQELSGEPFQPGFRVPVAEIFG